MSLKLYLHPLASFCWKVLIPLYENETPFEPVLVDLSNEAARSSFLQVWPVGKFPVLRDDARGCTVPESSIIIEYLDQYYPGKIQFIPRNEDAWRTRQVDRFYDLYVHEPMQKIVLDKLRGTGQGDPVGVAQARSQLATAYAMIEKDMANKTWAMGEVFSLPDCAASPALYYANLLAPLGAEHPSVVKYLERLQARPSFARVLAEAKPYFDMFPG